MLAFFAKSIMLLCICSLCACTVGPNFVRPHAPLTTSYGAGGDPKKIGKQQIQHRKEITNPWWSDFHSFELNKLIEQGLRHNYSLTAARETLQQTKEKVLAAKGQLWPQVSLDASAGRQQYGVALFGPSNIVVPPFTYYEIGPSASLLLDVFGGTRRNIEKQRALMTYQYEELRGAVLSVVGNIATTALTIASINEQIATIKQIIQEDYKNLSLVQQAFRLGASTRTDVLSAQSQKDNDETLLPPLYQQLAVAQNMLSVLVGIPPANWQVPNFQLKDFILPKKLALIIPSELAHKRPDILAMESMLHAANATIGIATANLYPSINLTGSIMLQALTPNTLFQNSASAWSLLGSVTAPIFNGGTLRAERRAAVHACRAAYANYQQVVIKAFSQVNDALHALKNDELAIRKEKQAILTAKTSLDLARISYNTGNATVLQVLDAERLYTKARLGYVQAEAQRYLDTIQLYIALGG